MVCSRNNSLQYYTTAIPSYFLHLHSLVADLEDQLARRLSARQIALSLLHALGSEGILVEDVDLHDTLAHGLEEELRVVGALLGGDHIVGHDRTGELEVLVRELEGRERRGRTRSVSERNERSFPLQELKVLLEPGTWVSAHRPQHNSGNENLRVLSNTVIHRVHTNSVRYLQHSLHRILLGIQNDVIRTMRSRELRLSLCRCRSNHCGAFVFGILGSDESKSSSNRVNENRIALLEFVRFVHERDNGRGLHETSSTGPGVDSGVGRDGVNPIPRDGDVLRIGATGVLSGIR